MTQARIGGGSYNGLAFGPGTRVHVSAIEGVDDLPDVRSSDQPRSTHGEFRGRDLSAGRVVTIEWGLRGADEAGLAALRDAVAAATVPQDDDELPLYLFDSTRLFFVRPRKRAMPRRMDAPERLGRALVEFKATDPRLYSATLHSVAVALPTAGGGATFPLTFPLVFGAVGAGGLVSVSNAGNFPTGAVLRIDGPVSNPSVEHVGQGRVLRFAITLAAGEYLLVDTDARTVLLNGTASRRGTMTTAQWFQLTPGENTLRFGAPLFSAGALLTVQHRDAWL